MDKRVYELLEKYTRKMDAFSQCENYCYLLILPETDLKNGQFVAEKISTLLANHIETLENKPIEIQVVTSEGQCVSIKEMLESIDVYY